MTPLEAESIYHEGCTVEYRKHQANYTPVNQHKVTMAGFQAVIDAVEKEQAEKFAASYLNITT